MVEYSERMSTGSSTFRSHHLSEYSTIMRAFPQPFVPSTTPIVAVHNNTPLGVAAAAAAAGLSSAAAGMKRPRAKSLSKSGFYGVSAKGNRWKAEIRYDARCHYLGTFDTKE
jgi:hypothetical protein